MARRREACATACIALAALLCAPAEASAATYVLRPNATVSNAWTVTPSGSTAHAVLDDDVLQPSLPNLVDNISTSSGGTRVAEVGVPAQQVASGDTVTTTTAWAYVTTGTRRSLTLQLMTGSTSLASASLGQNLPAQWVSASTGTALSQSEVQDLRIKLTLSGTGASTASLAYAAYVDMRTAGVLNATSSGSPGFSVTLDGTDQAASYTAPIDVADTRDTNPGWNLTMSTTQFSTGGGSPSLLPAGASSVTGVSSSCSAQPCVAPTNAITYPIGLTADAPAVKFFNAASGTGTGQHTITPTIDVAVPANTDAGSYSSTLTFTIASGP